MMTRLHPIASARKYAALVAVCAAGFAAMLTPSAAQAAGRHGHGGHGHFSVGFYGGGGHWGGHRHWGGPRYWRGGGYWGPSFSFYAPLYWDAPYYRGYAYEPVVVSRAPTYAWPDNTYRRQAYADALNAPLGRTYAWDDSDGSGTITTLRDGRAGDRYCREFMQEVMIDGKRQKAHGAACQNPDGSWEIVPDND